MQLGTSSPRSGTASPSAHFGLASTTGSSADEVQSCGPYGNGRFQRRTLFFGMAAFAALVCHSQAFALIAGPVDHWCKPPPQFSYLSVEVWKNVGIPLDEKGRYSQCYTYVHPNIVNDTGDQGILTCVSWDYDQRRARQTVLSFWNMVCHRWWMKVLADAVYMSGALVIVPLAGYVADISGRQPVITAAVMALLFSSLGSCCADTYFVYVATRFVSSGSVSSVFVITIILLYEVTPFKYQAQYIVLMCTAPAVCADVFILFLVLLKMPWFWLQPALLSPTVLLLSAFCVIYESPLWLITKSRFRLAQEIMKRAARINGVKLGAARMSVHRLRSELNVREGTRPAISPACVASTSELRARAAIIFLVTFATMLAYYRMLWAVLQRHSADVSKAIELCVGIPCYVALYIAVNIAGRKQILLFEMPLLGGLCSLCGVAVYARPWHVAYVFIIVAKQCAVLTIATIFLFTAELFPTGVRCAVMCAAYACGRFGAIVASSLRLLKKYRRDDAGFAIISFVIFVSLILVLRLPETKFRSQEGPNTEQRTDPLFLMQESLKMNPSANRRGSPRRARDTRP